VRFLSLRNLSHPAARRRQAGTGGNDFVLVCPSGDDAEESVVRVKHPLSRLAVLQTSLRSKDLVGIAPLTAEEIHLFLDAAALAQEARPLFPETPLLAGKAVIHLFLEPSTRTRTAFESAERRMGAKGLDFPSPSVGAAESENLAETASKLEAQSVDWIVVRHPAAGAAQLLAGLCRASVINAGDGMHEHPTRAFRDALAVREKKGHIAGLKIALVGDAVHSRVARSETMLFSKLGADVWVGGPPTLIPCGYDQLGCRITWRMEEAIDQADVVLLLPLRSGLQDEAFFPSGREYFDRYGLTQQRVRLAKPDAMILPAGPMTPGVEIAAEVAIETRPAKSDADNHGIAVCMAVLYLLSGKTGIESRRE
jgi:aspartate carbamoyltransferase catalytic subunit